MNKKAPKDTKKTNKKALIAFLVMLNISLVVYYFCDDIIYDKIKGLSYHPAPEMSAIEEKIDLTNRAKTVFAATAPVIEDDKSFNLHCSSHDADYAILGCYGDDRIYVYNIDLEDLKGIMESTTAHELLHAVWARLSNLEKSSITDDLEKVYSENCELLCDVMSQYSESDRYSELYARIGTEVSDLPEHLQEHYDKYFNDRQKIVAFYKSYADTFEQISRKQKELEASMDVLDTEIESLSSQYETEGAKYIADVDAFNACANTAGCFNEKTFYARRNELTGVYAHLEDLYNSMNSKINEYNIKVEEYNDNLLYGQKLEQAINSNAAPRQKFKKG